jgi:MoaA/NifB/PqqE/SkfB family radical SAM enzyme
MADNSKPRVRFTWNISYDCNYRCSYCFFQGKWEEYKSRNIYLSAEEWVKYWGRICQKYGPVNLIITGGEPFIYPDFIGLIKGLSKICFHINISTNASVNLEKFVKEINPENISISLSFQREFDTIDCFIKKVRLVRKHNFKGCLNLVAYPPFLKDLVEDNKRLLSQAGEEFKIVPFFGKYKDVEYPEGYSQQERLLIGIDQTWFNKVKRKGSLCSAGYTSALVFPDGKVARCGQIGEKFLLGNFFDPELKLFDQPTACSAEYCPCQEDSIEGDSDTKNSQGNKRKGEKAVIADGASKDQAAATESKPLIESISDNSQKSLVNTNQNLSTNDMIKFAWDMHYKCNFRCPYCWFYKDWARLSGRNLYLSPDQWLVHWKRIYDRYGEVKIDMVGGEPFVYPNFTELVKKLSSIHLVKITTNLSGDVERFAREIDPRRVDLDLNFHILFIDLETVIKKTLILKKAGFKVGICYLAYPPQMFMIKRLSARFKQEGINFALAAFWGEYNGKQYPLSYTEEEKEILRPYLGDINRVTYHLNAQSPKNKLCRAGFKYADIQADGNVVRCSPLADKSIGNILDKDFKLFDSPRPCDSDSCSSNEYVNLVEEKSSSEEAVTASTQVEVEQKNERAAIKMIGEDKDEEDEVLLSLSQVKYPRRVPPYRVHWNWELSLSCNYKCSYCGVWPNGQDEKHKPVDIAVWKEIWDKMFEKYWCCHVRCSGGEPTIYPGFFDIVSLIQDKHTVDITTNLSFDIKEFTKKVKPGGISISASFHPEYNRIEPFLEKVLFLHHNGYPSTISYVAYPPYLKNIQTTKPFVEERGIIFKIIPYQGKYTGKNYPEAYSVKEKMLIEGLTSDSADSHVNELNERWYDWNVKRDREVKAKKGALCQMGQMYAKIYPDGKVARCCALDKYGLPVGVLGQITDLGFRLNDEPMPCEADRCPCFKGMLVGLEEDKWLPLWEALEHPKYKTKYLKDFLSKTESPQLSSSGPLVINSNETRPIILAGQTKVDRQAIHPYRVFFTWDIHYACNYRCEYCFFAKKWSEVAKENRYPGLGTWKSIWDNIYERYGSCHIHVSGGEPFTYPDFIDLTKHIIGNHTIEFDTNLSFDIDEFISKIQPGKVKFATAFHPTFVSLETYLHKIIKLREANFDVGINYVAYPKQLKRMKQYKDIFEKERITFTIMPFRGEFEGREYPMGYTDKQKKLIIDCDSNLTVSSKMVAWYGAGKLSRSGSVCRMGQMYTKVHPNGEAYRCCFINDKGKLGNLIDGTFALWDEPKVCEYPQCPCWTAMVVGKEKDWQDHWVIPRLMSYD